MQTVPALPLYETDLFIPSYRPFEGERWVIHIAPMVLCKGYWSEPQLALNRAGLLRREPDHLRTWMSMTPMEIESQELGCRAATGHTVVMGLGMGWAAANAALQPAVSRVTVVERDPEVIGLVADMGVFQQLPPDAAAKVAVVEGDALAWKPESPADTLLADIWGPLNGDERVEQVRTMRANTGTSRVYFWGQEMVIARRARDTGRTLDTATVDAIIAELDLPLIGPEFPNYADLATRAAAHWMRDV